MAGITKKGQALLKIDKSQGQNMIKKTGTFLAIFLTLFTIGCTPRVEVAAPKEPITINLNVKIDHEIRVRVEKDLDQVISKDSGLF